MTFTCHHTHTRIYTHAYAYAHTLFQTYTHVITSWNCCIVDISTYLHMYLCLYTYVGVSACECFFVRNSIKTLKLHIPHTRLSFPNSILKYVCVYVCMYGLYLRKNVCSISRAYPWMASMLTLTSHCHAIFVTNTTLSSILLISVPFTISLYFSPAHFAFYQTSHFIKQ